VLVIPNPTAEQILVAARATAAGDMVGVAIDGNIGTLKTVASSVLIGDGLFLNGQGPATLGGIAEPGTIAIPPLVQGSPFQVFTLTIGTDTFTGSGNGDQFNAPLAGAGGDQPTVTDFDNLVDTGINAVLNAVFDGDATATGVNIVGIPTWNIQNHHNNGTVVINSGGSSNSITGLKTLNYNANGGSANLEIGTVGAPIMPAQGSTFNGFAINVSNALGTGHVDIAMLAAGFGASDAINVTALAVGTGNAGTNGHLPDPPPENQTYDIAAGSPTAGFATWNVKSIGNNNIALGADGNHSATSVVLTDTGGTTALWAASASGSSAANFGSVTTVDVSATTGTVFITGHENGSDGFLAANNAITTVKGGSGADTFDLSSLVTNGNGISINGGTNAGTVVELSNGTVNAVSGAGGGFALWTGVPTLADLSDGSLGGTIDMSRFPGTGLVILADSDSDPNPAQTSNFLIKNAQSGLTFDFQQTDQNSHNVEFDAVITGAQLLTVEYTSVVDSGGQFLSTNFANVHIITGGGGDFYSNGVKVEALVGDPSPMTLTFSNTGGTLNIAGEDTTATGTNPIGHETLVLVGGNIIHPTTGELDFNGSGNSAFGVTNAFLIHSTGGGSLEMSAPGNDILFVNDATGGNYTGITVNVTGGGSYLQGSLGPVTDSAPFGHTQGAHLWAGQVGTDSITDNGGGTNFFGDGGSDTISLANGGNNVWFGAIGLDPNTKIGQIITNTQDHAFAGFWGSTSTNGTGFNSPIANNTSSDVTGISGFNDTSDQLHFNATAWAGGGSTTGSLVHANGAGIGPSDAVFFNATGPGAVVGGGTDVVLYNMGLAVSSASQLAFFLADGGVGNVTGLTGVGANQHMLFAYQSNSNGDIVIADVDFLNGTGAGGNTAGRSIVASDVADLGANANLSLLGLAGTATHSNIHFENIG
jgi:hypothetical protein